MILTHSYMRVLLKVLPLLLLTSCFSRSGHDSPALAGTDTTAVFYPYAQVYSADMRPGDPRHVKTILEIWKMYEAGRVRDTATYFADTLRFVLQEEGLYGDSERVLERWQHYRSFYPTVQLYADMWMPVYLADKDEHWVMIWGRHKVVNKQGKRAERSLHQAWRIDKRGKVNQLLQYDILPIRRV